MARRSKIPILIKRNSVTKNENVLKQDILRTNINTDTKPKSQQQSAKTSPSELEVSKCHLFDSTLNDAIIKQYLKNQKDVYNLESTEDIFLAQSDSEVKVQNSEKNYLLVTKMQPDIVNCSQEEKMDTQELKEFEILENMCKSDDKNNSNDTQNSPNDFYSNEISSFDEVDFKNSQNNFGNGETNNCDVAKNISEHSEKLTFLEDQRYLDIISEECSGDFFETPPSSIDSVLSNNSTMEENSITQDKSSFNFGSSKKTTDNKSSQESLAFGLNENLGNKTFVENLTEPLDLLDFSQVLECTTKGTILQSSCKKKQNEANISEANINNLDQDPNTLQNTNFSKENYKDCDSKDFKQCQDSLDSTKTLEKAYSTSNSKISNVSTSSLFQGDNTSMSLDTNSTDQSYTTKNGENCDSKPSQCYQDSSITSDGASSILTLTSLTSSLFQESLTSACLEKNTSNKPFAKEYCDSKLFQGCQHSLESPQTLDEAFSNSKSTTLSSSLFQESLTSAPRVSLESADVKRPLIDRDVGAATLQTECAEILTCSRDSLADRSRVISSQQEAKTPANTQNTADNNSNLVPLTENCIKNHLKPEQTRSKCVGKTVDSCEKTDDRGSALCWGFKNGRLVFGESTVDEEQVVDKEGNDTTCQTQKKNQEKVSNLILSKELNKRAEESRLKSLETKLKNAGINDEKLPKECESLVAQNIELTQTEKKSNDKNFAQEKELTLTIKEVKLANNHKYLAQDINTNTKDLENKNLDSNKVNFIDYAAFQNQPNVDSNQNEVKNLLITDQEDDLIPDYNFLPEGSHNLSEFNAHEASAFPCPLNNVYREFLEDSSSSSCGSECSCDNEEPQEHYIVISRKNTRRMRGDGSTMSDSETKIHNPDKNNLKSLLKRPSGRKKDKNKNRVVFNENKNEFFDADYIILIREDCDFDEEDDDGVCTCNQHEMVRLTCCEPNCNCQYDGYDQTPPSPKFAPPIEFVDAVTLSPPEGYKDMELGEEQLLALQQMARRSGSQRGVVCRECSASHDEQIEEEGECSLSEEGETEVCQIASNNKDNKKERTDQSQQTTPTTPPCSDSPTDQRHIINSMMTTSQPYGEEDSRPPLLRQPTAGSPISGILKGGRLWKQSSSTETNVAGGKEGEVNRINVPSSEQVTSDDETSNKRSVRFLESSELKERRDVCDGAPQPTLGKENPKPQSDKIVDAPGKPEQTTTSPEMTEMTLTFKLGSTVLVSNNSLKPNSAVRQLFPNTKTLPAGEGEETSQQYLVTAESLRAFEDSKRSKLPQIVQPLEGAEDTFKRAIERNTLRRSLIRYEPRSKKQPYKTDNSLVERIKQLTCNVDDNNGAAIESDQQTDTSSTDHGEDVLDSRSSPPGEEARNSPDVNTLSAKSQVPEKSFSPSSSSTISSSSSSMSSASNYHHSQRTDIIPDIQNNFRREAKPLPDIGGPHHSDAHAHTHYISPHPHHHPVSLEHAHCAITNKMSSSSNTSDHSRRQFLSTLAPLTACVMGTTTQGAGPGEDYYYSLSSQQPCDRMSVASSIGTEYSLEDIDEGLKNQEQEDDQRKIAPDVLAGTPSASESGDELAMFVQQDMNRIERIKKKYQPDKDEDDEHDDYGFNRRPSVRGIKPRFGTTTEILQQIQNQLQPPPPPPQQAKQSSAWPYYSDSNLSDSVRPKNVNPPPPTSYYSNLSAEEAAKARTFAPPQYRPTSLHDQESLYQNCTNQRCGSRQELYHSRSNVNIYQSTVVRVGNEYYQSLPRQRNGRPQSPPPMEMAKSYHQTMVYIPYNHIESGYQPVRYNYPSGQNAEYVSRVTSQNQINSRRYVEPIYPKPQEYGQIPPLPPKLRGAQHYPAGQPPPHMVGGSRCESPAPGQFSTARSTQTGHPTMQTCGYYPPPGNNPRYRPMINPVWPGDGTYATSKMNRHSYPARLQDSSSLSTDSDSTSHSGSIPNGYNRASADMSNYATINIMASPTKSRFIERGVPEGAASVSPQDLNKGGGNQTTSGTMTSPTSPQNPPTMPQPGQKPMFYAMNV